MIGVDAATPLPSLIGMTAINDRGPRLDHRGAPATTASIHTVVGALRDLVLHIGRDATWRLALASAFAFATTQLPLRTDTALARGLLFLGAITAGANLGKRLDPPARPNRRTADEPTAPGGCRGRRRAE
jgi:hypothetical protein